MLLDSRNELISSSLERLEWDRRVFQMQHKDETMCQDNVLDTLDLDPTKQRLSQRQRDELAALQLLQQQERTALYKQWGADPWSFVGEGHEVVPALRKKHVKESERLERRHKRQLQHTQKRSSSSSPESKAKRNETYMIIE